MYPLHPITGDYADFTEPETAAFRESLRNHGLMVPIVIWHDQIVDGRHRARFCEELGIELRPDDVTDRCKTEDEMIAYVRALNEHRRANTKPLTTAEKRVRIEAALKANPELSNRQIAEKVGASHPTVAEVREQMEATGKITSSESTIGKDGKSRKPPAPKPRPRATPKPPVEPPEDVEQSAPEHSEAIAAYSEPPQDVDQPSPSNIDPTEPTGDQQPADISPNKAPPAAPASRPSLNNLLSLCRDHCREAAGRLSGEDRERFFIAMIGYLTRLKVALAARDEEAITPAVESPGIAAKSETATATVPVRGAADDDLAIPGFLRRKSVDVATSAASISKN